MKILSGFNLSRTDASLQKATQADHHPTETYSSEAPATCTENMKGSDSGKYTKHMATDKIFERSSISII